MVVVIVIMAALFTVGTTILTIATSDYKSRVNESKRLQNLYKSDSGLDLVYNIILKNSQAAITHSIAKIEEEYKNVDYTESLYDEINEKFADEFLMYLGKVKDTSDLAKGIEEGKYLIEDGSGVKTWQENIYQSCGAEIKIKEYIYDSSSKKITIKVESTFENPGNNGELKNTKTIATSFNVEAPAYKENKVLDVNKKEINIYPVYDGQVIIADGDMKVQGQADIIGDIWIKGSEQYSTSPIYTFEKYNGGILVDGGTLKVSSGDIFTAATLSIRNKAEVEAENIFSLNTYVGPSITKEDSGENKLTVANDLITDNDLSLNSNGSIVNLKNYYGINEYTFTNAVDPAKAAKESSSIIINNENSTLNISNDAYIMGVAYIDTIDEKYQTGESLAVKGNYLAYSEIVPGYEDKITLKYYNPLQLVETIENSSSVQSKAKYFKEYYDSDEKNVAKTGGVSIANINSVGAVINSDGTVSSGNLIGDTQLIKDLRNSYAINVLSMGYLKEADSKDVYDAGEVIKTVKKQIDFNNIEDNYQDKLDERYGKVILIKDGSEYKVTGETTALIITNGKVVIEDGAKFTGNIITTQNIEIKGQATAKYDAEVTEKIIASNYQILEPIFKDADPICTRVVDISKNTTESQLSEYDMSFIKSGYWKIVR